MAILKIRDAEGNVQEVLVIKGENGKDGANGKDGVNGKDGEDYVLTDADKQEIADLVGDNIAVAEAIGELSDQNAIQDRKIIALEDSQANFYPQQTFDPESLLAQSGKAVAEALSDYYTKTEVDAKIPNLSGYAKTSDIPDVSTFVTEAQVLEIMQANMPIYEGETE